MAQSDSIIQIIGNLNLPIKHTTRRISDQEWSSTFSISDTNIIISANLDKVFDDVYYTANIQAGAEYAQLPGNYYDAKPDGDNLPCRLYNIMNKMYMGQNNAR